MRRTPMYRSLWKPIMFMRCERIPFLAVALSSGLLVMEGGLWVKVGGIVYFAVAIALVGLANSKDSFFFQIIFRYVRYQDYYPSCALFPGRAERPHNF